LGIFTAISQAIYEKEMLAILRALKKWRPYPMGRHLKVKMDHDSLKYFLDQILSLEEQKKWVTNMLGYDFDIIYRKGKQNFVADALSRRMRMWKHCFVLFLLSNQIR